MNRINKNLSESLELCHEFLIYFIRISSIFQRLKVATFDTISIHHWKHITQHKFASKFHMPAQNDPLKRSIDGQCIASYIDGRKNVSHGKEAKIVINHFFRIFIIILSYTLVG